MRLAAVAAALVLSTHAWSPPPGAPAALARRRDARRGRRPAGRAVRACAPPRSPPRSQVLVCTCRWCSSAARATSSARSSSRASGMSGAPPLDVRDAGSALPLRSNVGRPCRASKRRRPGARHARRAAAASPSASLGPADGFDEPRYDDDDDDGEAAPRRATTRPAARCNWPGRRRQRRSSRNDAAGGAAARGRAAQRRLGREGARDLWQLGGWRGEEAPACLALNFEGTPRSAPTRDGAIACYDAARGPHARGPGTAAPPAGAAARRAAHDAPGTQLPARSSTASRSRRCDAPARAPARRAARGAGAAAAAPAAFAPLVRALARAGAGAAAGRALPPQPVRSRRRGRRRARGVRAAPAHAKCWLRAETLELARSGRGPPLPRGGRATPGTAGGRASRLPSSPAGPPRARRERGPPGEPRACARGCGSSGDGWARSCGPAG